jgi:hypothetical protein
MADMSEAEMESVAKTVFRGPVRILATVQIGGLKDPSVELERVDGEPGLWNLVVRSDEELREAPSLMLTRVIHG